MSQVKVHLVPVTPHGPGVSGIRTADDALAQTGTAGWNVIDRARRISAAGWIGVAAYELTLPILIDGIHGDTHVSVEQELRVIESWRHPSTGKNATGLPPILRVGGPTLAPARARWVLQKIEYGERLRNRKGHRIQQAVTLTLLEYVAPTLVESPAKRHKQRHPSGGKPGKGGKGK